MERPGLDLRRDAMLRTLTGDVVKSSEIEGEILDKERVRSSTARRPGIEIGALAASVRHVDGVVELTPARRKTATSHLMRSACLAGMQRCFRQGGAALRGSRLAIGATPAADRCRLSRGPLVVNGFTAKPRTPPGWMLKWGVSWNGSIVSQSRIQSSRQPWHIHGLSRSTLSRTATGALQGPLQTWRWRVPRTARNASKACRPKSARSATRTMKSCSPRKKGDRDITPWLTWFPDCIDQAIERAGDSLASVFEKARFWEKNATTRLNDRQRDILNRLPGRVEGKLTTSKHAKIEKCSQDTAYRDIIGLIELDALKKSDAGGRSTSHSLVVGQGA